MRRSLNTLIILLLMTTWSVAQNPMGKEVPAKTTSNPSEAPTPADPRLDQLLNFWEARMSRVEKLLTECKRLDKDGVRGKTEEFVGKAAYLKPNLALLDLKNAKDDANRELFVSNGNFVYEYQIKNKLLLVHEMPKNAKISDDTMLSFLFGMKADDAKKRYQITLQKAVETDYYIYLKILPRQDADKQEFSEAQLVFYAPWIGKLDPTKEDWSSLPARIFFKQPNGNEVTWSFLKYDGNAQLEKTNFVPPKAPEGWRVQRDTIGGGAGDTKTPSNPQGPPPSKIRQ
jgi:TIGR03009 family protein